MTGIEQRLIRCEAALMAAQRLLEQLRQQIVQANQLLIGLRNNAG